jgi:tungstate transport system ATP-binding protein
MDAELSPAKGKTAMTPILEARDLRLMISGREILNIDHFGLKNGEVLALIGPNGSGKSTLLKVLALIEPPTAGAVYFNGHPVYPNGNLLSARRRMALVFQEALLFDTSVYRNIMIALRIRGITGKTASERAQKWLDRFGISHLTRRPARRLSGGEAQRANLARAFALEPDVLFLDEPFSALDYPTRKTLLSEMGQLLKSMNMTTLFVTHDYTEIPYLASDVSILFDGKIKKSGTVQDIFGDEMFEKRLLAPWEGL